MSSRAPPHLRFLRALPGALELGQIHRARARPHERGRPPTQIHDRRRLPGPHAAPAAVPLPAWTSLVVPGIDERATPWRQIPAPDAEFDAAGLDVPSAAVLPPIEFPV